MRKDLRDAAVSVYSTHAPSVRITQNVSGLLDFPVALGHHALLATGQKPQVSIGREGNPGNNCNMTIRRKIA